MRGDRLPDRYFEKYALAFACSGATRSTPAVATRAKVDEDPTPLPIV
jgi:hypothetical protein